MDLGSVQVFSGLSLGYHGEMSYQFTRESWTIDLLASTGIVTYLLSIYIIRKYLSIFYNVSVYDTLIDITGDGLMSNLDE